MGSVERIGLSAKMQAAQDLRDFVATHLRDGRCQDLALQDFEAGHDDLTEYRLRLLHVPSEFSVEPEAALRMARLVPGARYVTCPNSDNSGIYHYITFPTAFPPHGVPARYQDAPREGEEEEGPPSLVLTMALLMSGACLMALMAVGQGAIVVG